MQLSETNGAQSVTRDRIADRVDIINMKYRIVLYIRRIHEDRAHKTSPSVIRKRRVQELS